MNWKYIPAILALLLRRCGAGILLLVLSGGLVPLTAAPGVDSLGIATPAGTGESPATAPSRTTYHFPELDAQLATAPTLPPDDDNLLDELLALEAANHELVNVQRARDVVATARQAGNFLRRLDSLTFTEFPVILADTISNVPIAVVFDDLRLYPEYAQLAVVVEMQLPQRRIGTAQDDEGNTHLYFGTPNLKLSHDGGIIGDATLGLYGDVPIGTGNPDRFGFVLRGNSVTQDGGEAGTFVRIDCDGFVEMGLAADVLFSRDWIVPVDAAGTPQPTGRVQAEVQAIITDWNDLLVELSLPDFALAQYDEVAFHLQTAVLDFSDYRNSSAVVFPPAYAEQHLLPDNPNLWRGVYIQQLEVALPAPFTKRDCASSPADSASLPSSTTPSPPPSCRTRAGVAHLLIDQQGVSGLFYAEDVLTTDQGNMDGWRFSVTDLELEVVTNELAGFGFGGEVGIPVTQQTRSFNYAAFVNIPDRSYAFALQTNDSYEFPLFQLGEVAIDSASYIEVVAQADRFQPTAVLYGHAAVRARWQEATKPAAEELETDPEKIIFAAARIDFAGLRLTTQAPYLDLLPGGYFGFSNEMHLVNFPVSIATPELQALPGGRIRLGFGVSLNLMKPGDGGFAATCGVGLVGKLITQDGYQQWRYAALELDSIAVAIHLPQLKIDGKAYIFRDDPVYGRGWQGHLAVDILQGKFNIELNAIFGRTSFKYWYVDGLLTGDAIRVPIIPGVLYIDGFGGGAYYHMQMAGLATPGEEIAGIGAMSSGVLYTPNEAITLGLKASVSMKTEADLLTSVNTFELAFAGTGLQEVLYYGQAELASPELDSYLGDTDQLLQDRLGKLSSPRATVQAEDEAAIAQPENAILMTVFLRMNFSYGFEYQGVSRVYLDAAAGAVTGYGGTDLLFSEPQDRWHIYVGGYHNHAIVAGDGAPLPPVAVRIRYENDPEVAGDDIIVDVGAYLLTGNDIPGPPPMYPAAAAYFGTNSLESNNRAGLAGPAALGTGFAFGAYAVVDLDVDLYKTKKNGNKKKKGWFRADLGAGFDLSLLRYGSNTYCSASGDSPHGHRGWRATGRIWAYVDGQAKWGIIKQNLSLGLLLDADVPKPSYFLVHLKFRLLILNFNLKVPIGERCGPPFVG